jgi:ParB-like chromosome segregation protein Spo0J
MRIPLANLCGCFRLKLDDAVEGYRHDIRDGVFIAPIVVTKGEFGIYNIIDGRRRAMAFFLEGVDVVDTELLEDVGELKDAA